jgi:hypothetical protein
MASIADLFIKLGVKTDATQLNKINATVTNIRNKTLLMAGAFTGATIAIEKFVDSGLRGVVALKNINLQTGLSIEKLQRLQQIGQLANLSLTPEQITNSVAALQKSLKSLEIGQGNIAPFQLLRIDPRGQDAFSVIEQLRENIKGIDPSIVTNQISNLGLNAEFINILKLSNEEFEKLGNNIFLSKKQRDDIDRVGTSIKALSLRFKALKDQAIARLAPDLDKLVNKFFKWLKDNGEKVIQVMNNFFRVLAKISTALTRVVGLLSDMVSSILSLEKGIYIITALFGLLALSVAPFLTALSAIILLLEDIAVYKAGGDSLIGDLIKGLKELPVIGDLFNGNEILGTIAKIIAAVGGLSLALNKLPLIGKAGNKLPLKGKALNKLPLKGKAGGLLKIGGIGIGASTLASFLSNKVKESGFSETSLGMSLGDNLLKGKESILTGIDNLKNFFSSGNASPVINNNISINGVQSPELISQELERNLTPITQKSLNDVYSSQNNIVK